MKTKHSDNDSLDSAFERLIDGINKSPSVQMALDALYRNDSYANIIQATDVLSRFQEDLMKMDVHNDS